MPVPAAPSNRNRASHQIQTSNLNNSTDEHSTQINSLSMVGPSHPMPRQRIYFGPYLLLQTLGEGEFGKVKLGVHSSPERWGEEVAIKLIKRGNVDTQARMIKVAREIDVLKLVKHPNIVRLYDVIETEKYIGIVLEYASGGELFDHILAHRYLKEKDASKLFAQLISGVTYLHAKKIVHRDLKLENLLLDRNRNIIITDFGFANRFEDRSNDLMATSCGSPCYAAPELVVQDGRYVGSQVDVWSCGVILYAMLAGYLPFDDDPSNPDGDNINLLYKYIINTPLSFPEWITDQPKDLLLRMLVPDPLKRCALSEVTSHPWLAKYAHLFDRSIEELELISEDNEQQKRMALQAQRQAMAASNGRGNGATAGDSMGRSQSAAHPSGVSGRARAHQSAMVVPTTVNTADNDFVQSPSAYQQQRQQSTTAGSTSTSGPVTHLQPAPSQTAPPPSSKSKRAQAQSAMVIPTSTTRQNKENEVLAGMEDVHNAHGADHKKPVDLVNDGEETASGIKDASKKRKVNAAGVPPGSNQQRYTVQVEYSATPSPDSRAKGKAVERAGEDGMVDRREQEALQTPKMSNRPSRPTGDDTPTARDPRDVVQDTTPQPNRTTRSSNTSANPVINVTQPLAGKENDLPFPSPPLGAKNPAVVGGQLNQVHIGKPTHTNVEGIITAESVGSKKESRHRKGMSTDRFLSRLLGSSQQGSANPAIPPLPTQPPLSTSKKPNGYTAIANASKNTRRKALSMVVEPLSGKIPGTSSANRANRKSTKVVPATPTSVMSPTSSNGSTDPSRRPRRGSAMVPSSSESSRHNRRMTLAGSSKKDGANGQLVISNPVLISPQPQAPISPSTQILGEETVVVDERGLSGSPNWSQHTAAGNSTSQLSSSSSKAKRVMDWFRFKSLNTSTTSTHMTMTNSHQANYEEGLIPPTPFTTDFDERRKNREPTAGNSTATQLTSSPKNTTKPVGSNSSISTREIQTTGDDSTVLVNHNTSRSTSTNLPPQTTPFNDSKLKLHHGAIDQNAISSISPPLIMLQLKKILWELGIEVTEENSMKLKAMRRSKKKVVASLGIGVFEALQQQQQNGGTAHSSVGVPTGGAGGGSGGFKSIFQRKASGMSVSGIIDQIGNVGGGNGTSNELQPLPAYADDPSVDSGDDVRFTVEITKLRGLNGLYAVDIKRLKGSLWSFKYLYLQILEKAELGGGPIAN
ncbi:phosphotransferase [Melampsora americana]|nr:phosphotransferase [Melampsora americana]